MVEALQNLLQAGSVELGLGAGVLGLLRGDGESSCGQYQCGEKAHSGRIKVRVRFN